MILSATGHRPNKLGGYSPEATNKLLKLAIGTMEVLKPKTVISGMALGWDMAIANAAIHLNIPFTAAVPFQGQESMWPEYSRKIYHGLLEKAETVTIVSPGSFSSAKMQTRNEFMVDNCDLLLALWDGSDGGTHNCIRYAKDNNVQILNVYEHYLKL